MRKGKILAALLTIALCITPCNTTVYYNTACAENAAADYITSEDGLSVYYELEDGTVSLVSYKGEPVESADGSELILTFPDTVDGKVVSGIEATALDDAKNITYCSKVVLPKGLQALDIGVFRDMYYFTDIEIDESNTSFTTENGVLFNKDKTTLIRVAPCASAKDSDTNHYVIPDTVTEIGDDAFYNSNGVLHLTIPASVQTIGENAFYRYLGNSSGYFTFKVAEDNAYLTTDENGHLFSKDKTVLYRYSYPVNEEADMNLPTYEIPDTVKVIASSAFQGSTGSGWFDGLLRVTIPDSVTTIGESAFEGCTYLEDSMFLEEGQSSSLEIPDSVTSIGKNAFRECPIEAIVLPKDITEIAEGAFSNCTCLASVEIPAGVKKINASAFSGCSALLKVILPDTLETIDTKAFFGCTMLGTITVPESVTKIGDCAMGYGTVFNTDTMQDELARLSDFVVVCVPGSAAAKYAEDNEIPVKDPADVPSESPEPTDPASSSPTPTEAAPSQTPDASNTPAPSQTPSASNTPAPSQKPDTSNTPGPSAVPTQTPHISSVPAPTGTPKASATAVPSQTADTGTNVKAPAAVKLSSVKNVKGKKLQITWKKNAKAAGYQVQYAPSAKFKNAKSVTVKNARTTKATIKKLKKGNKYYVRVRAYAYPDKAAAKLYSKWSNVKKAVIKK